MGCSAVKPIESIPKCLFYNWKLMEEYNIDSSKGLEIDLYSLGDYKQNQVDSADDISAWIILLDTKF